MVGVLALISALPLLSGRDIETSIFRARYSEGEITEAARESIRQELGLDSGIFGTFVSWMAGVLRGDLGTSWITRQPVLPGLLDALITSVTLMVASLAIAVVVAGMLTVPAFRRGLRGRANRTNGGVAAAITALPDFLLASALLIVFAVLLPVLPPYGWNGAEYVILPALAMGLPAGGLLGRLLSDALADTFGERWIVTWQVAGYSKPRIVAAALRRSIPSVAAPTAIIFISITASAVVIERVYSLPGIGRATLGAAQAQDLPTLQGGVLLLMLLAVSFGIAVSMLARAFLGPAFRSRSLPAAAPKEPSSPRALGIPVLMLLLLVVLIAIGLPRDPEGLDYARLQEPSWQLPFGADASGRDVLARIAHGAASTLGMGVVVTLACLAIGFAVGLFPRAAAGPIEITNAAPPILSGLIVAAILGPSAMGAAIAVTIVSWAPLASHTASLVNEVRAQPHVSIAGLLGVGEARLLTTYVLPRVAGPVARHAALRLPGTCLALATLGFLGLGPQPPDSDWGLVLAEGLPYAERAPLLIIMPTVALIILAVLAVSATSLNFDLRRTSARRKVLTP